MEKGTNKNIEERVDDVLKNRNIMNLRAKLRVIEHSHRRNYVENKKDHFERYNAIANYFDENKDRIKDNEGYLVEVLYNLTKHFDSQEDLVTKVKGLLNLTKYGGTGTGVGVSI